MRTRVTGQAWFGPKRFGRGLSSTSWHGWITITIWTAALAVGLTVWPGVVTTIVCLAALALVLLLTSDPPGGSWGRGNR